MDQLRIDEFDEICAELCRAAASHRAIIIMARMIMVKKQQAVINMQPQILEEEE